MSVLRGERHKQETLENLIAPREWRCTKISEVPSDLVLLIGDLFAVTKSILQKKKYTQ